MFFARQSPEAIQAAVLKAAAMNWNYSDIRDHALSHFSKHAFFKQVEQTIEQALQKAHDPTHDPTHDQVINSVY